MATNEQRVVGSATKVNWDEKKPFEKTYFVTLSQNLIKKEQADDYGSLRMGIKGKDIEVPSEEGQTRTKRVYDVVTNPKKGDNDIDVVIEVKKKEVEALKGKGDFNDVAVIVGNRKTTSVGKDKADMVVYENPIVQGMTDEQKKEALRDKRYVGTGWTQKPELYKLDKEQINSAELKDAIKTNHPVKVEALLLQGKSKIVNAETKKALEEAKSSHGEKFSKAIEENVNKVLEGKKKKGMSI